MSKEGLRNRLLGTWQLVSSVIRFEDGEFRDQLGYDPSGFLIYTAEGYVSAVLGASNRPLLATNDPGIATDAEFASETSSFLAYERRPSPLIVTGRSAGQKLKMRPTSFCC